MRNLPILLCLFLVLPISGNWTASYGQDLTQVSLELVLAVDISTSVDSAEFALQQQGLAAAFRHPTVRHAIENTDPQGIAVSLVQWSGPGQQRTSVPRRRLHNRRSIENFATEVGEAPRLLTGFTDIAGAIRFSHRSIAQNRFTGLRQVIDVSGDGSGNGPNAQIAKDQVIEAEVTVNGLVIHNEEYDLGELAKINLVDHYRIHVVGGIGSFLMIAKDFEDFREAIRKKLVREITGPLFSRLSVKQEKQVRQHGSTTPLTRLHVIPRMVVAFAPSVAAEPG